MYVIVAVSILTVISLSSIYFYNRNSLQRESAHIASGNLQKLTNNVDGVLRKVETAAANMVWLVEDHLDDPEYMYSITQNLVIANEEITGSTVAFIPDYYQSQGEFYAPYTYIDADDHKLRSIQMGNDEYNYFEMEWFKVPFEMGKSRWSEPYFDEGGGDQLMTTYSTPIRDTTGKIVAILTSDVSLQTLTNEMLSEKIYEHSYVFALSRSGAYIAHPDSSKLLTTTIFDVAQLRHSENLATLGENMLNGISGSMQLKIRHKRFSAVYGPIKNGWSACYFSPNSEVYSGLTGQMIGSILVSIINMLLLFLVVRKIVTRTSDPITEFTFTALNIAKGNFDTKLPTVKHQDELKRLRDALGFMVRSIKDYMIQLTAATASKERLESELNIASQIQNSMLTKDFPTDSRVDLFALLHPAKEVGGDLYDFFIKDNKLYFAVGDVSGKGVPAALFMAITRSAFRFIAGMGMRQSEVLYQINNAFCDGNTTNMFVTMFIAKVDLDTGKMHFCNAGHNPVIIMGPDGKAQFLHAKPNLAAGLFEDFKYEDEEIELKKGSRIFVYTDGVSEAENREKELFGDDRLIDFVSNEPSEVTSEQFVGDLLSSIREFTAGNEQNDDITMMSIKL